jgi:Protein of unknown function (DUF1559)/Sigma-70, region 4
VMPILDAELGRLPAKHRDVLILCLLNGASAEEAAGQLGCPVGTVKSRLARAREALRDRLVTRGIAPAVALAVLSTTDAFASPVSPILTRATLELLSGSSIAPGIAALTKGVFVNMLPRSAVMSSMVLAGLTVAGVGTAWWMKPSQAQEPTPAVGIRRESSELAARQEAKTNNMKLILLAFHNYHDVNGHFPSAANYGADGQPKLSWRVALLPYLDQNDLYNAFRQDESWDSPHNKALIDRMPAVYQTPDSPAPAGQTRIRGFAGKGAMFDGAQGITIQNITDGTSNTVLIATAREAVPWTQPAELPFGEGQPGQALDTGDSRSFALGLVDGSVRTLPAGEARMLRWLITRAGGEVVVWPPPEGVASAGVGGAAPAPGPTPAPTPSLVFVPTQPAATPAPAASSGAMMSSYGPAPRAGLEERLQRVEAKLDRVLQKLDEVLSGSHPSKR